MDNLIILNGHTLKESATLKDLRDACKQFNAKIVNTFTFEKRNGLRRVLKLESQGYAYIIQSSYSYWSGAVCTSITPQAITFDSDEARNLASKFNGNVERYLARELHFHMPHVQRLITRGGNHE